MKRLLEDHRHERGLAHRDRPFRHRLRNRLDVDRLEILLIELGALRLPGDAEDGNGIGDRRVKAGDHVGARRPRSADADPDIARLGAAIAVGHMRSAFDMTGEDMTDRAARLERGVKRIDRSAGNAEGAGHAFFFEHANRGFDCFHPGHMRPDCRCRVAGVGRLLASVIARSVTTKHPDQAQQPCLIVSPPLAMTVTFTEISPNLFTALYPRA